MEALILAIMNAVSPLVLSAIKGWQERTGRTDLPTLAELTAEYEGNRQKYLTEIEEYRANRPPA